MATAEPSKKHKKNVAEPLPISCYSPPSRPLPDVYDNMISITVGSEGASKESKVYRGLLCYHSSYFDNMLNGDFKEGGSEALRLHDIESDTFKIFYDWMNTNILWINHHEIGDQDSRKDMEKVWKAISKLYAFADYAAIPALKNVVLDQAFFQIESTRTAPLCQTPLIYSTTTPKDALRNLVIDTAAESWGCLGLRKNIELFDKVFLVDYIFKLKEMKSAPGALGFNSNRWVTEKRSHFCERYHIHEKAEKEDDKSNTTSVTDG